MYGPKSKNRLSALEFWMFNTEFWKKQLIVMGGFKPPIILRMSVLYSKWLFFQFE
jgi:hypothetical protein